MEEIEYKLKKKNCIVVANAITKLVDTIKDDFVAQQRKSTITDNECNELEILRSKCADVESLVSLTACQGIITLVEEGVLDASRALSDFIASVSYAKNYIGITQAIGNLLLYDMTVHLNNHGCYKCVWNIRLPQHPMITVLQEHKDIWVDVLNQIEFLCHHNDLRISENSIELLRPVFLYILCNPSPDVSENCRLQFWNLLVRLISKEKYKELTFLILIWFQRETSVLETSIFFIELSNNLILQNDVITLTAIMPSLLSISYDILSICKDPRPCFTTVLKIVQVCAVPEIKNLVLILLADILLICPMVYLNEVVHLCDVILNSGDISLQAAKMISASLLQWMAYPTRLISDTFEKANELLLFIEKNKFSNISLNNLMSNIFFNKLKQSDAKVHLATQLLSMSIVFYNNKKLLLNWLENTLNRNKYFLISVYNFLCGIFVTTFDNIDISKTCLQILLKIVEFDPEYSYNVLILIVHKLSKENDPEFQMVLLKSIPKMAVLKENIPFILQTLDQVKNGKSVLRMLSISLYSDLVQVEVRCFPYLQKLLIEGPKSNESRHALDIVKAQALKEICISRSEYHGSEVVSLLSTILNRCGSLRDSVASALALEAITALCHEGIIDLVSTWKALAPKLNDDKRPIVIKSLCQLFSEVPSLCSPQQEYENFISEIVNKLWSLVLHEDSDVSKAALKALSNFNIEVVTLKHLPKKFRQNLKLPSAYCKTPLDAARKPEDVLPYVPGQCWLQLLQNIHEDALSAAGDLLIKWINLELKEYRSGVYMVKEGQGEPASYSLLSHKSIIRALASFVQQQVPRSSEEQSHKILLQCLRILSQQYCKVLPPINWCFLHEIFHYGDEEKSYCLAIASRQASISGSAHRFMENYLSNFEPTEQNEKEILMVFDNLVNLCRGVPPKVIQPYIEKMFDYSVKKCEKSTEHKESELFKILMLKTKQTLLEKDIHDANRNVLSLQIELLFDRFTVEHCLFEDYAKCAISLRTKFVERMTSPSVWWEITNDKLRKATYIRSMIVQELEYSSPLNWMNECIDTAMDLPTEHSYIVKNIIQIFKQKNELPRTSEWILELMGRIQGALTDYKIGSQQIEFLCNIYVASIIALSCHDLLTASFQNISVSKDICFPLFGHAVLTWLQNSKQKKIIDESIEWLYSMGNSERISVLHRNVFSQSLVLLRHENYFKKMSVWTKILSNNK